MPRSIVDVHVVQTVPPSNLNRDDTGSPKTATYGGTRRARVSSQAWKRATRTAFGKVLDDADLGVRSKRLVELVGEEILVQDPSLRGREADLVKAVFKTFGKSGIKLEEPKGRKGEPAESGYLVFLSRRQITGLAELAVEAGRTGNAVDKAEAKRRAKAEHSVDISLFGRMIADDTDLNVDAAAQVAHAISVHAVQAEYDYFTAVDDHKNADQEEDAGASMIGTVEFNSSTLYRYATVDVDRLQDNLGDATATRRAVEAFVRAFVTSMPTGKQNTFANRTLPDAVLVILRDTQAINLVGAFEQAVEGGRHVPMAIERLTEHAVAIHDAYDEAPLAAWAVGPGPHVEALTKFAERSGLDVAVSGVGDAVAARLR